MASFGLWADLGLTLMIVGRPLLAPIRPLLAPIRPLLAPIGPYWPLLGQIVGRILKSLPGPSSSSRVELVSEGRSQSTFPFVVVCVLGVGSSGPVGRIKYFSFYWFLAGFRPKLGPGACPTAPA